VITLTAPPVTPVLLRGLNGFQLRTLSGSSPGLANPGDGGVELPPLVYVDNGGVTGEDVFGPLVIAERVWPLVGRHAYQ
jgi:hypothetical protein